jgi:hypothetical protein
VAEAVQLMRPYAAEGGFGLQARDTGHDTSQSKQSASNTNKDTSI